MNAPSVPQRARSWLMAIVVIASLAIATAAIQLPDTRVADESVDIRVDLYQLSGPAEDTGGGG